MVAGLRNKRVADDALVVGIFIHGVIGSLLKFAALGADCRHQLGLAQRELVQVTVHAAAGCRRVAFRNGEQAHSQIREPIAHFAESDTSAVGRFDHAAQLSLRRHGSRIVCELARQI